MFASSEEAIRAAAPVHMRAAAAELDAHGHAWAPGHMPGTIIVLEVSTDSAGHRRGEWVTLDCRTDRILEWLGY
jgi:hypothetical protein